MKTREKTEERKVTEMHKSDYRDRLEAAIRYYVFPHSKGSEPRKIVSATDLLDAMETRSTTEKELRPLFKEMSMSLEPPNCEKGHCEKHSEYAFCGCTGGKVPGRCKEAKEYLDKVAKRDEWRGKLEEAIKGKDEIDLTDLERILGKRVWKLIESNDEEWIFEMKTPAYPRPKITVKSRVWHGDAERLRDIVWSSDSLELYYGIKVGVIR